MMMLAFYKGRGRIYDRLIRLWTRSPYSHVELVERFIFPGQTAMSWSSSPRDGGVRGKAITFDPDKWDLVPVDFVPDDAVGWISMLRPAKYDWVGILLSQIIPLRRHSKSRWFCSEVCAMALALPEPHTLSPANLKILIDLQHAETRKTEFLVAAAKIPKTKQKPRG